MIYKNTADTKDIDTDTIIRSGKNNTEKIVKVIGVGTHAEKSLLRSGAGRI